MCQGGAISVIKNILHRGFRICFYNLGMLDLTLQKKKKEKKEKKPNLSLV